MGNGRSRAGISRWMGWRFAGLWLAGVLAVGLAGCGDEPPPAPDLNLNACGSDRLTDLVGMPLETVQIEHKLRLPPLYRIHPRGAPVSLDFNPRRLNIITDPDTGRVEEVSCG